MRRILLKTLALMITLAALSACGTDDTQARANEFQVKAAAAASIEITASVTADYGDRVLEFGLKCISTADTADIFVTSPELIAGISAHMDAEKDYLSFDGLILDTGDLDEKGLSPLTALPEMIKAWREGYLSDCGSRDGLIQMNIVISDSLSQALYLNEETLQPTFAELISDGTVVVRCEIEECVFAAE